MLGDLIALARSTKKRRLMILISAFGTTILSGVVNITWDRQPNWVVYP